MDPEAEPDENGFYWDSTAPTRNLGLDFFSQPPTFPTASSHSGGRGAVRRRGADAVDGLDLNSETADITDNMSFLDLLQSSPAGCGVEGDHGGVGRGVVRSAGRGPSRGAGRGAGRGTGRAAGRVAAGGRGTGRAAAALTREAAEHDVGVPSLTSGGGRGRGRATPSRHPTTTVPRQFRPPRPAGERINPAGAADAAFDGGLQDQDPASYTWSQNPYDEDADDIQEIDASSDNVFDKADWANSANNAAFCELCVEEIKAGNTNKGHPTNRGYTNIATKFEERTGLRHSKQQLKNRWDALRRMYSFWLWMNKETGLGRRRGTVVADDAWWEKHTKGHGEWKKLLFGPPENLDELEVMFQNIAVDGSSSCIPGEEMTDAYEGDDSDMRFTFAVAGWPGSAHDMRVFNDAINKYGDKFPHPPQGKFYLVDSGFPNRPGYLAPYKGTKYHLPEFQQGPRPRGKKEVFNYFHSHLRNVIERSFGVLKMKWRILLDLPAYPMRKQNKIIHACMALHNFIRESKMRDQDFDMCDQDEEYMPLPTACSFRQSGANNHLGDEDVDMNAFRDAIANALFPYEE